MGINLQPEYLRRYKDIAMLLMKYGRSDVVKDSGLDAAFDDGDEPILPEHQAEAEELAKDLEALGPTFIKLGQLLSTRAELLPDAYLEALSRLQDQVEPFPFEEVEKIVTDELGVRLSKAFSAFESEPVAAASIGQVHRAALRDGRAVAVKVQRPDIRPMVVKDLEVLGDIAAWLDKHTETGRNIGFEPMMEQFRKTLLDELDYRREAANLAAIAENLKGFERIVVPRPVEDYSTSRVLTMEYVRGTKIDELSPLARIEIEGEVLADELFRAYLQQILVDGLFHADPHPGNVFLTHDRRLALVDLGMVGRVDGELQQQLLKLLLALGNGEGDRAATVALEIGQPLKRFDEKRFRRQIAELVSRYEHEVLADLQVGKIVLEMCRMAAEHGVRIPPQLTILGKALLKLDEIGRCLDPEFDPNAAIRRHASEMMSKRFEGDTSMTRIFSSLLEAKEFIEELPGRVNRTLDMVTDNRLRIRVDAIDQESLILALRKIANRVAAGIILAAMIIGASLMMRIETRFTLLGYPGIAMVFFLIAAVGGLWMVWDVIRDRPPRDLQE